MKNETNPPETAEGGAVPAVEHAADPPVIPDALRKDIEALCAEFADTLHNPDYGSLVLRRQVQLLDHLVYTMMNNGKKTEPTLRLVLQIQKQCMDTAKAASAIEYMKAIIPHPLPPNPASELKDT